MSLNDFDEKKEAKLTEFLRTNQPEPPPISDFAIARLKARLDELENNSVFEGRWLFFKWSAVTGLGLVLLLVLWRAPFWQNWLTPLNQASLITNISTTEPSNAELAAPESAMTKSGADNFVNTDTEPGNTESSDEMLSLLEEYEALLEDDIDPASQQWLVLAEVDQ